MWWVILNLGMFVLVILMQPLALINWLRSEILSWDGDQESVLLKTISNYVQPLIIVTLNSGVIPVLVDIIADLEKHKTKSSRQVAIMKKNFIFQIINAIFLQITLSASIKMLIDQL